MPSFLVQIATALAALPLFLAAAISNRAESTAVTKRSAVLYQNNGNWAVSDHRVSRWVNTDWLLGLRLTLRIQVPSCSSTMSPCRRRRTFAPAMGSLWSKSPTSRSKEPTATLGAKWTQWPFYSCWKPDCRFNLPLKYQSYLGKILSTDNYWFASSVWRLSREALGQTRNAVPLYAIGTNPEPTRTCI